MWEVTVHREKVLNLQLATSQCSLVPTFVFVQGSVAVLQPPPYLASGVYWSDPTNLIKGFLKNLFSSAGSETKWNSVRMLFISDTRGEQQQSMYKLPFKLLASSWTEQESEKSLGGTIYRCVGPCLTLCMKSKDFHCCDLLLSFPLFIRAPSQGNEKQPFGACFLVRK